MLHNTPLNLSDLPVYQKALDIFALSQNISTYLNHDLSNLESDGSEDNNILSNASLIFQHLNQLRLIPIDYSRKHHQPECTVA